MITEAINQDIKIAMKSGNIRERDALRYLKSKIQQTEKDSKKLVTEEMRIKIVKTLIKQNNDTLKYNPTNKATIEREIKIWEKYLPNTLNNKELKEAILLISKGHNITNKKEFGKLMGLIKNQLGESANMKEASIIVKSILV